MKKIISLFSLVLLLSGTIAVPIYAQSDSADKQLADLLSELEGSEIEENTNPAVEDTTIEKAPVEKEDTTKTAEEEHDAAEDILDSIEGDEWSFAGPQKIEIDDIKEDGATVITTEVLFDGASVDKYKIFYSLSTLSDISNFDSIQSVEVPVEKRENNMAYLKLKGLTPETKYYITVTPVHPTDPTVDGLNMSSSEVTFTTLAAIPTVTPTTKLFEDVSFTQNKNTLTVTWTPTSLVENGSLQIRHKDDSDYVKVGTVSMASGKYTFTVNKPGSYFLKLHGVSDLGDVLGQEQVQNIKVEAFEQPEAPVQAAPQVGPTTDLIMMLFILAMVIYFVYRFRRIEK